MGWRKKEGWRKRWEDAGRGGGMQAEMQAGRGEGWKGRRHEEGAAGAMREGRKDAGACGKLGGGEGRIWAGCGQEKEGIATGGMQESAGKRDAGCR